MGNEFVMVLRKTAKQAAHLLAAHSTGPSLERDTAEELRAALERPAEQHQGRPTGLSQGWNLTRQHDGFVIGHSSREPSDKHKQQALKDGYVYVPFMVEQHQGEPVAWRIPVSGSWFYDTKREACEREYADYRSAFTAEELAEEDTHAPEPLYTHADPGEVERLRIELSAVKFNLDKTDKGLLAADAEVRRLRDQLAERDALLRDLDDAWNSHDGKDRFYKLMAKIEALSASAEPSALIGDGVHDDTEGVRAALERKPPVTPRDAFAAWEPTGNPIRGVNGRLAAKAGFDAGWCAGWTECRADMERKP